MPRPDDGSRGVDDQFIRSAMARITWQVSSKWKLGAYHDEIDKYRGHDMQSKYDPETAAVQWFSPAYHTNQAKLTGTLTPRLLVEGGFSSNLEYYTNSYQDGIGQARGSAAWYANTNQTESDLGGWKRAAQVENTQSPARFNWQGAVSYVTGRHNLKTGFQYQQGTFYHTYDANGDLDQVYRSSTTGIPYSVPDSVIIRACFDYGRTHPLEMPGHRSVLLLQRLPRFLELYDAGSYSSDWDVCTADYLH